MKVFPVFEPTSKVVIVWEVFHIIVILAIFFWMPFKFSFGVKQDDRLPVLPSVSHVIEFYI